MKNPVLTRMWKSWKLIVGTAVLAVILMTLNEQLGFINKNLMDAIVAVIALMAGITASLSHSRDIRTKTDKKDPRRGSFYCLQSVDNFHPLR